MPGRNEPCPRGSGARYKVCPGDLRVAAEKVSFMVAGTQKGGTTALASYLQEHPAMKLIMLLRDPVARTYSHWYWNHDHARGRLDPLPFDQAIAAEAKRRDEALPLPLQTKRFSYVNRGFYSVNARSCAESMSAKARRYLCDVFAPEVRTLQQMLGWDCSDWLAPDATIGTPGRE